MRYTSLHVSQKHSHGCHCTTGDIIVFQACTALTELNLKYCRKLTGEVPKKSLPMRHTSLDVSQQNSHGCHCV